MAVTVEKAQLSDSQIAALVDAKKRLAARVTKLKAMQARARTAGNSKVVAEIAAELKEADGFKAQIGAIEATIKPFMDAYAAARLWVSDFFTSTLGELGVVWVPYAAAGAITAVIYAVNVWDRKTETSLQRYENELKAHDEWVKRGKTGTEATALVQQAANQYSKEQQEKPSTLGDLKDLMKLAGIGLLALGAWQVLQSQKKSNRRTA